MVAQWSMEEIRTTQGFGIAKTLFMEYAEGLGIDLSFQAFDKELEELESHYVRPNGILMVAYDIGREPLGCFGIRKLEGTYCELKRLYVREAGRGRGLGKALLETALTMGKELGYSAMRLDTLSSMESAMHLYRKAGFYEIPSYRYNPMEGAVYFERKL